VTDHFDAVVVGSGFGASVTAYRLAKAKMSVCVLERGKRYPPGSFARTPREMATNLWEPQDGLFGLFDIWSFRKLEALVSSGLGGGSLIYANVMIRKDEKWFVNEGAQPGGEAWPITYQDLHSHYDAVERMLGGTTYPYAETTLKTQRFQDAATAVGLDWFLPELAVTFVDDDGNARPGVPFGEEPILHPDTRRHTCRLCGECDVGCNYGSKNTLDFNYLPQAKELGAEIRTLADVRRIAPRNGPGEGFTITYLDHSDSADDPERTSAHSPEVTVTAKRLVLGAGTLGSTYLLLRNRAALRHLSPALGSRFSGNGDLLTFLRRAGTRAGGEPIWLDPSYGPVITSAIRVRDSLDGDGSIGRGFYLEDGGYPQFADWLAEALSAHRLVPRVVEFVTRRLLAHLGGSPRTNVSADIGRLFNRGIGSGARLPVLAMGRDVPNGEMRLEGGSLAVDWDLRESKAYFDRVERSIRELADALGACVSRWPLLLFKRLITVHPVGGCPMGVDARRGVVDARGRVFEYPGLYVADGAAMPGPVGPNPSFTIAAFADRVADAILVDADADKR
jgi:cholesterol oxidase